MLKITDDLIVDYIDSMGNDLTVVNAARVSFGDTADKLTEKDQKLINYLAKHSHFSPFEHCSLSVKIACPMPISKQIMRHRTFSYNEISRRYTDKGLEFFCPQKWRGQAKSNKQCSDGEIEAQELARLIYRNGVDEALNRFDQLIALGVSREQARFMLPQGLQTEFYMSGNLRNWAAFVALRDAKDAQSEVQIVGKQIKEILLEKFPYSAKALLNGEETSTGK